MKKTTATLVGLMVLLGAFVVCSNAHALMMCFDVPCSAIVNERTGKCSVPALNLRDISCTFNGEFSRLEIVNANESMEKVHYANRDFRYELIRIDGLPTHIRYTGIKGTDMPICESWSWQWKSADICFEDWCPHVEIERPVCNDYD